LPVAVDDAATVDDDVRAGSLCTLLGSGGDAEEKTKRSLIANPRRKTKAQSANGAESHAVPG